MQFCWFNCNILLDLNPISHGLLELHAAINILFSASPCGLIFFSFVSPSSMAALYLLYLTSKGVFFLSLLYKISHIIRCKMMGTRLCFLIALCSAMKFYNRVVFQTVLSFFLMDCASNLKLLLTKYNDFGCGFLIFGFFSKIFNVFLVFFLFVLGFLLFQYSGHCKIRGKSMKGNSLMCSCNHDGEMGGLKVKSFEVGTTNLLREKICGDQKFEEINETDSLNRGFFNDVGRNGGECEEMMECCDEDQVFDVITLRKMVKTQRKRANVAQNELEKERMAAASSVDEAMAMILRLQNEKSVLYMQVNQLERVSEEKQLHDQEVIQSFQWIVMKHESERSILEDQLRMCREKLKMYMKGEEWDQFDSVCPTPSVSHSTFESKVDDLLIDSIEFGLSPS